MTVCELHLFRSSHVRFHPFASLDLTYLVVNRLQLLSRRAASAATLARQGGAGQSELGAGAASPGSVAVGSAWRSAAQEAPPVTEALEKKHRIEFKLTPKQRDPFRGKLLKSK